MLGRRRRRLWLRPTSLTTQTTKRRSRGRACTGRGPIPGEWGGPGEAHRHPGHSQDTVTRVRCSTRRPRETRVPSLSTRCCSMPDWTRTVRTGRTKGGGGRTRRRAEAWRSGGRDPRTWWRTRGRRGQWAVVGQEWEGVYIRNARCVKYFEMASDSIRPSPATDAVTRDGHACSFNAFNVRIRSPDLDRRSQRTFLCCTFAAADPLSGHWQALNSGRAYASRACVAWDCPKRRTFARDPSCDAICAQLGGPWHFAALPRLPACVTNGCYPISRQSPQIFGACKASHRPRPTPSLAASWGLFHSHRLSALLTSCGLNPLIFIPPRLFWRTMATFEASPYAWSIQSTLHPVVLTVYCLTNRGGTSVILQRYDPRQEAELVPNPPQCLTPCDG
jgi:hypothetical protein